MPNRLIHETSPYLLQHAYNPVAWWPWCSEALAKAKEEDKLIIISIGYSACHWCHVMEHQCFENEEVAKIMNDHFICIKVDREERPDIDQIYMLALQIMTGQGGWPLNCICLPNEAPIYGGTYFPADKWMHSLKQLANFYKEEKLKAESYAADLRKAIQDIESISGLDTQEKISEDELRESIKLWTSQFDTENGGFNRAPKFPMPANYKLLLTHAIQYDMPELLQHVALSLNKMAHGGIYDQLAGGFARYSTDKEWKVPHFEKMLYDNAQLISLYSQAYTVYKNPFFKQIAEECVQFLNANLKDKDGGYYAALDADTEGEEGKFYLWTIEELQNILPAADFPLFLDYFQVNEKGYWAEESAYILLRNPDLASIAFKYHLSADTLENKIASFKALLLAQRNKRTAPALDDKILCSWNALMISALVDAYKAFANTDLLVQAEDLAAFILDKMLSERKLCHSYKHGKATSQGFLEDYAFTIEALLKLYLATGNDFYAQKARELTEYVQAHFAGEQGFFYFSADTDRALIARKMEINDNVIPSSNAAMAHNLFLLSIIFDESQWETQGREMVLNIKQNMLRYPGAYAYWLQLAHLQQKDFTQILISGKRAKEWAIELYPLLNPFVFISINPQESNLPFLKNRWQQDTTLGYVCKDKSCLAPVKEAKDLLKML